MKEIKKIDLIIINSKYKLPIFFSKVLPMK